MFGRKRGKAKKREAKAEPTKAEVAQAGSAAKAESRFRRPVKDDSRVVSLEQKLARQRDVLFGITLYFEGLEVWSAGRGGQIEASREKLLGIVKDGRRELKAAEKLLQSVREGETDGDKLDGYAFSLAADHPERGELLRRAETLLAVYASVFPGRERTDKLSDEDKLKLVEGAAKALG